MIDLKKAKLPQAIDVGGSLYRIHTDYRYFLRLREHLAEKDVKAGDLDYMYIKEKPLDRLAGVKALIAFMTPPQELPRRTSDDNGEIVLDFAIDADYIYAAFMEQYGIDLLTARLHWYSFNALLHGLHDTELNNIINARLYKPSGRNDEYEKTKQRQYEAWRLPQPADNEPDEALEDFLGALKG